MASVMKNMDEQNETADEQLPDDEMNETPQKALPAKAQPPVDRGPARGGKPAFFSIYKHGQGYWTRMGTVAAVALVGMLAANFLYTNLPIWFNAMFIPSGFADLPIAEQRAVSEHGRIMARNLTFGIIAAFTAGYALLGFWLINKPGTVDFLIATDSEMKKVNWTSRKDLIGSTKVVILFMFMIALILFVVDLLFGYFFQAIKVLKYGPFQT